MAGDAVLTAIHGDETAAFLERLGLADAYTNGELRCAICSDSLVTAGLGAVRGADDGEFEFVCTKLDCQDEFHSR
jgi:hypothetical protein